MSQNNSHVSKASIEKGPRNIKISQTKSFLIEDGKVEKPELDDMKTKSPQKEYNHLKSYIFSGLAAISFGFANYLLAYVSSYGIIAMYP